MRIAIVSYRSNSRAFAEEEIALLREARSRGYVARILRARNFQLVYDKKMPWLLYNGKPMGQYDVIIPRVSVVNNVDFHLSLVKQMEMAGYLVINKSESIMTAKNKMATVQVLDEVGIPMPKTIVVRRQEDLDQAVKLIHGFPLITKRPVGSFGNGVTIVESMRNLKSLLDWEQPMYLLQEYVKYSKGKDLRIFVVNGKVVASMMRSAKKGEFRANIELGAVGVKIDATPEEEQIALRAVQAVGLHYAGVDIMRSKTGPLVLEVNSNPGFKKLEVATQTNVSKEIIDYAVELSQKHRGFAPAEA